MENNIIKMTGLNRRKPPMFKNNSGRKLSNHAIMHITKGHGYFEDEGVKRTEIRAGHLFFLRPGVWHNFDPDTGTVWTEYWVLFDGEKAAEAFGEAVIPAGAPVRWHGLSRELAGDYERLHAANAIKTAAATAQSLWFFHSILIRIHAGAAPPARTGVTETAKNAVRRAVESGGDVDFRQIAEAENTGYEKFRKDFARETGVAPHEYLTSLKMARAKELLARPDMTVKEIAAALGHGDPYYFSRLFKRKEGLSPESFRRNIITKTK
jgi:AraC-like DNA-binding protein